MRFLRSFFDYSINQCHAQKHQFSCVAHVEKMINNPAPQHLVDCQTLTATELRKRYSAEANSHRNMLQRATRRGNIVHPAFQMFRDFLTHVGPRPCIGATLDRINNCDPEYAPGKVRWAGKRTQNSNKGDTLLFHYSRTNDTYTVSRVAKLQNVSPTTIRKRLERGWTDDQIIEGERRGGLVNAATSSAPLKKRPHTNPGGASASQPARDIMWERRAASVAHYREEEGEEYCLCDYETLAETAATFGITIRKENYDRHFARWWAEWKPHLKRKDLPEWARALIAKIEGISVAEIQRRQGQVDDLL